jgi:hypothetical protein
VKTFSEERGGEMGKLFNLKTALKWTSTLRTSLSLTCTVFIPGSSCFFRFPKSVLDKEKDLGKNHRSWNNGTALPGKVSAHEQNNKKVVDC